MKSDWTCGPMLRFYIFIKKADVILACGGSVVAFMIGGWTGVAWWVLALIAIPLWIIASIFFRGFFFHTREMKEAMLRPGEEPERGR